MWSGGLLDRRIPPSTVPGGSGKRYEACHGIIGIRPLAVLVAECDLVVVRELLPSATAPLPLREPLEPPHPALREALAHAPLTDAER
jgi:hypothetical protein